MVLLDLNPFLSIWLTAKPELVPWVCDAFYKVGASQPDIPQKQVGAPESKQGYMQATFFSILLHYKGTAKPPEQEMVKAEANNGNNINNIIRTEILSNLQQS